MGSQESSTEATREQSRGHGKANRALAIVALLLSTGAAVLAVFSVVRQVPEPIDTQTFWRNGIDRRLRALETRIEELSMEANSQWSDVDLTISSFQRIDDDFMVSVREVNEHLSGIRVTGEVLNKSSVDRSNASFVIEVADIRQQISIIQIDAGRAAAFEAYLPDVPAAASRWSKFRAEGSTITFRRQE